VTPARSLGLKDLQVKSLRTNDLTFQRALKMGLGQFRGPSWWTGSKLPQSDLYRDALRVLCQWISNHCDFKRRREQSLERAEARGEAALPSPQPSQAWIGGASGGLVCVERTLLSAASDSCPEKRG
jgi:hypothetical protein